MKLTNDMYIAQKSVRRSTVKQTNGHSNTCTYVGNQQLYSITKQSENRKSVKISLILVLRKAF